MKFLKVLLGTAVETISGRQPLALQNLEDWDNLWQVIQYLKWNQSVPVSYWECMSSVAFDRGKIEKSEWHKSKIYSSDLLISMEHELADPNQRHIYIRKGYARRLLTPIENKLGHSPIIVTNSTNRPYVIYFNDHNGHLLHSHDVLRWLELLDTWTQKGLFRPHLPL